MTFNLQSVFIFLLFNNLLNFAATPFPNIQKITFFFFLFHFIYRYRSERYGSEALHQCDFIYFYIFKRIEISA